MTKQELDQALQDGRIGAQTYDQLMKKAPVSTPVPQQQAEAQIEVGSMLPPEQKAQINPMQARYSELMAQYQQNNKNIPPQILEREYVLPQLEKEQEQTQTLAREKAAAAQKQQQETADLEARKTQLGVIEQPRKPAADGMPAPELLENPMAPKTPEVGMKVEEPKAQPSMAAPDAGLGRIQSAYGDVAKAEQEFTNLINQQKEEDKRHKASALEGEKIVKGYLQKADDANKEFVNGSQIDPGRYWAKADTWSKIGAVLGAAFSGYAQAYTGGRNVGLDMIKAMIDTDVEAQRQNAVLAQSKAQQAMNLYERYRQAFKDDQAAYDATKLSALNLVKAKYDMAQGKFKNAAEMAKLDVEMKDLNTKLQTRMLETGSALTQAIDITRNPNSKFDNELNRDPQRLYNLIKENKVDVIRIGNKNFVTSNTENAKNLRNNSVAVAQMGATLDQIAEVQKSGLTDFQKREQFESLKAQLIANAQQQYHLGTLDEGLLRFAEKLFAGFQYTNITGDAQKAISSYKNRINNQFEIYANTIFPSGEEFLTKTGTSQAIKKMGKQLE